MHSASNQTPPAIKQIVPLIYSELHRLASHYLRGERSDHTLQPTALVHEAYLKLVGSNGVEWRDSRQVLAASATAMRHILVNHAVSHRAAKRGGGRRALAIDDAVAMFEERSVDLLALNEALTSLA